MRTKNKLMTFQEATDYVNIKRSRLRTAVRKREVSFVRLGRLIRFQKEDLDLWVINSRQQNKYAPLKSSRVDHGL